MGELKDKIEGEVKDTGGKMTGDKKMEWEGKGQKAKGDVEGASRAARLIFHNTPPGAKQYRRS